MPSKPPFFAQESDDTCAHACLRMLLAFRGITVTEQELQTAAPTDLPGLYPDELARLARQFGLPAAEQQLDRAALTVPHVVHQAAAGEPSASRHDDRPQYLVGDHRPLPELIG